MDYWWALMRSLNGGGYHREAALPTPFAGGKAPLERLPDRDEESRPALAGPLVELETEVGAQQEPLRAQLQADAGRGTKVRRVEVFDLTVDVPEVDEDDPIEDRQQREAHLVVHDQQGFASQRLAEHADRPDHVLLKSAYRGAAAGKESLRGNQLLSLEAVREPDPHGAGVDQLGQTVPPFGVARSEEGQIVGVLAVIADESQRRPELLGRVLEIVGGERAACRVEDGVARIACQRRGETRDRNGDVER